jgi:hypothetical protein
MNSYVLQQIRNLTMNSSDPRGSYNVMRDSMRAKLKMQNKYCNKNLLFMCKSRKIGTPEIESNARGKIFGGRMGGGGERRREEERGRCAEVRREVVQIIEYRIKRADREVKELAYRSKIEGFRREDVIGKETIMNVEYKVLEKQEMEKMWKERKEKNENKVDWLEKRFGKIEKVKMNDNIVTDEEMNEEEKRRGEGEVANYVVYGDIMLDKDEIEYLQLGPNHRETSNIVKRDMETESEKHCIKTRQEIRKIREQEKEENEGVEEAERMREEVRDRKSREVYDKEEKKVDLRNQRVTDLKTCTRTFPPRVAERREELKIQAQRSAINDETERYVKDKCNDKGEIKEGNLSKEEKEGKKKIIKRMKEGKIFITATDKSKKFVVTTPEIYKRAAMIHINKDHEIKWEELSKVEKEIDRHVRQMVRIFDVGSTHNQVGRCKQALVTEDRPPPNVKFYFKDHKEVKEGEECPATRMVCGAVEGPLHRASILLDKIIGPLASEAEDTMNTEVKSTEEVKRKFMDLNVKTEKERKEIEEEGFKEDREHVFFSQDVKALYPSIIAEEAGEIIEQKMLESDLEWEGVEWKEVGRHLAIILTKKEIEELDIGKVLPKRTKEGRKITMAFLDSDPDSKGDEKWTWEQSDEPDRGQRRRMLSRLVNKMVVLVMKNHVYQFDGKLYRQKEGGPIGLLLTGTISRIVMLEWDRRYLNRLTDLDLTPSMYYRYVDDQGVAVWSTPPGLEYKEGKLVMRKAGDEGTEDDEKPDKRTAAIYRDIGNSIMNMIQLTEEYPSKFPNNRVPVLDLEVWMEGNLVRHDFYRKPMASRNLVSSRSALSDQSKRSILIEEGLRRLRHVSYENIGNESRKHIVGFNLDLKKAGYKGKFREGITSRILGKLEGELDGHGKWLEGDEGGRPWSRTGKERQESKRKSEETKPKEEWFRQGGFTSTVWVPATPGGELAGVIQKALDNVVPPKGTKPKVVQLGGNMTARSLIRTDPFPRTDCRRKNCQLCWQAKREGKEGSSAECFRGNFGYQGSCVRCPAEDIVSGTPEGTERNAIYQGESSKTSYRRILQHFTEYTKKKNGSWMWEHVKERHQGLIGKDGQGGMEDYVWSVTGTFRECTTRIADESVRIKREEEGHNEALGGTGDVEILNTKREFYPARDVRVNLVQN